MPGSGLSAQAVKYSTATEAIALTMPLDRMRDMANALTFDVEDYFQVQAFADVCDRAAWERYEPRVERNTNLILDLLAEHKTRATFFTLGWIAERFPAIVRRIVADGHELASHGYAHHRVDGQTPDQFRADIARTKKILEDVGGTPCAAIAPRRSRSARPRLGRSTCSRRKATPTPPRSIPSLTTTIRTPTRRALPTGPKGQSGSGSTRSRRSASPGATSRAAAAATSALRRTPLFRRAIAHINAAEHQPAVFYLHPWEVDPDQPRPAGVKLKSRLRHYLNLSRTVPRLVAPVARFPLGPYGPRVRNALEGDVAEPLMLEIACSRPPAKNGWDAFVFGPSRRERSFISRAWADVMREGVRPSSRIFVTPDGRPTRAAFFRSSNSRAGSSATR